MKAYIQYNWCDDSNCHEPNPHSVTFQPTEGIPFNNPDEYGTYQKEITILGDLFIVTETSFEGHTTIHGVTVKQECCVGGEKYEPIFSTEKVIEVNWKEVTDPKAKEKAALRNQIAELTKKLESL